LFECESGPGAQILKKAALGTTDVEYVDVDGEPGIWIGGRHALYLPGGPSSAAGHVLLWQRGRLTLRLEAAVGRERALAIAPSGRRGSHAASGSRNTAGRADRDARARPGLRQSRPPAQQAWSDPPAM